MVKRKKILLGSKDVISRRTKDFQIEVQLDRTGREFVSNRYDNTFDLLKQYKRERNNCRNFRIYGTINSAFVDCDNLTLYVFSEEPQILSQTPKLLVNHIATVTSKPLISENWECKNVFNKKRGKYLIELDNYFDSDYVYIYIGNISPVYQNLFKRQLVYRYNTLNIMGERVVEMISYGSNEALLDIDGNVIMVENDFDFFYNKHWVKDAITINKVRQTKWIPDKDSVICVQTPLIAGDQDIIAYPLPGPITSSPEYPIIEPFVGFTSTTLNQGTV